MRLYLNKILNFATEVWKNIPMKAGGDSGVTSKAKI